MNGTFTISMGDRGRIVIPADVRERTGLAEGTTLVLLESDDGLVLLTREQLQSRIRCGLSHTDLVATLLADRRGASRAEDKD